METQKKLSGGFWSSVLVVGLIGQIAWIIENMYFNVFIDRTLTSNAFAISFMVGASAVCATLATFVGGIWSDRVGKRRYFISVGYIVWGVSIMAFSLVTKNNIMTVFGVDITVAMKIGVVLVVFLDCVMSTIGAIANDANFNCWVTDNTTEKTRGRVDGVLAVMPLIAMGIVFGGMDFITQDTYQNPATGETTLGWVEGWDKIATGNWTLFYLLLGGIVVAVGIILLFALKDSPTLKANKNSNYKTFFHGFKASVIKENKQLYLCFVALGLFGIANNAFMPYLIMYCERTLGFTNYIIPIAIIIAFAAGFSVLFGFKMDKMQDRRKSLLPLTIIYIIGAVGMVIASPLTMEAGSTALFISLCVFGITLMLGYLAINATLVATVRDLTPDGQTGLFQGVRMVFYVMIPMVIGPLLTAIINIDSPIIAEDTLNNITIRAYTPYMFAISAVVGALAIVPVIMITKEKQINL